jgi:small nuclear ribonucleoprotein (snRNP)-like protein
MEKLKESYATNYKNVIVKISDGSTIKGKVNIRETHQRLSDYFRYSQEQFITIISEETKEDSQNVFFVNKDYIVWIGPGK